MSSQQTKWEDDEGHPCQIWTDGEAIGLPEETFLCAMLMRAVLDAKAIAVGNVNEFHELWSCRQYRQAPAGARKGWAMEKVSPGLITWLWSDQFVWYVSLLGWKSGEVREKILGILRGERNEAVSSLMRSSAAKRRWAKWVDGCLEEAV
jgi:hypothetical protein